MEISIVKDPHRNLRFPSLSSIRKDIFHYILHYLGVVICILTIILGRHFHSNTPNPTPTLPNPTPTPPSSSPSPTPPSFTKDDWWKLALQLTMIGYSLLLSVKEILQIMNSTNFKVYFRRDNNKFDILAILLTLFTASASLYCGDQDVAARFPWMSNLIMLAWLLTWFQLSTDIMSCLPIRDIELYINMFKDVARTYVRIIACFVPPLLAFGTSFNGETLDIFFSRILSCQIFQVMNKLFYPTKFYNLPYQSKTCI